MRQTLTSINLARFQCKIFYHFTLFKCQRLLLQSELSVFSLGGSSSTRNETFQQGSRHHQVSTPKLPGCGRFYKLSLT